MALLKNNKSKNLIYRCLDMYFEWKEKYYHKNLTKNFDNSNKTSTFALQKQKAQVAEW